MNVNYVGSIAERKMKFSSIVSVTSSEDSDLFNSVSVYVPKSFAAVNIIDFDQASVTADTPALYAVTVDNYASVMQGDLLAQLLPIFRDDTNSAVVIYLIVFSDIDGGTDWTKSASTIAFAPLTAAFSGLFFLSYVKMLYDPDYSGENVNVAGTFSRVRLTITNGGGTALVVPAGTITFTAGDKTYGFSIGASQTIPIGGTLSVTAVATVVGITTATVAPVLYSAFTPPFSATTTAAITKVYQGTAAIAARPSTYFNLALALAFLAKSNMKLSCFWTLVQLDFTKITSGSDTNKCGIRSLTAGAEVLGMTSILTGDTVKYYWGALKLMEADNTFVAVDCKPTRNLLSYILREWFASPNASGKYVGNKLSLIRITGQNCFGPPSPINSAFNSGDSAGYDKFDEKNVGCLVPISSSSSGDSALSMCRGVGGTPICAYMISKCADYMSSQDCADLITDDGTLANPVLTNEEAYKKIQNIVINNVLKFSGTRRITGIVAKFPSFEQAKVSPTALTAASSWEATYVDDLDKVTISGEISA
jgi:hypothetical protein